jgi:peptidoglycan/xylan/chitin deacetylase (PgdA/CDA1 family)
MQEFHFNDRFHWPEGRGMAVALTFDFQGAEGVSPAKDGRQDYEAYTQAEYGPHTGVWRILEILEEEGVKATFFTCGAIGERYPDAVKAIAAAGHEVAGHGYHHEVARNLSREEETDVMQRASKMLTSLTGYAPRGWRSCTQSPNTLELLMEQGYAYNSNSFSHDLPFLYENKGKTLVELPRQPFGDGRAYGHGDSGNPSVALGIWQPMFDQFYEESRRRARFCTFQFHPYISGRAGRAMALRTIIRHMKKADVWFPKASQAADWCMENVFRTEQKERTFAKAS